MTRYRITMRATVDGKSTFATVDCLSGQCWRSVGTTKTYHTASRSYRAMSHAQSIIRRHHAANGRPQLMGPTEVI